MKSKNGHNIELDKDLIGDIGSIDTDGNIHFGDSGEGMIFKCFDNFKPQGGICYVPEYSDDTIETGDVFFYEDFIELTGGNVDLAHHIFEVVDWCYPSSYIESNLTQDSYEYCENCGYLFNHVDEDFCPKCNTQSLDL